MKAADTEQAIIDAMAADDWDEVARLEAELGDRSHTGSRTHQLGPAALWYAKQNLLVFPLQPRSKLPYGGTHGFEDATSDPAKVRYWWTARPHSNIGLATGHLVDVFDIDRAEGVKSWLKADHLPKPDEERWSEVLGVVYTPRARREENREFAKGGMHLYIEATGVGNRARVMPGIDYRGLGGYVVAPPSLNVEGEPYRWRSPLRLPGS